HRSGGIMACIARREVASMRLTPIVAVLVSTVLGGVRAEPQSPDAAKKIVMVTAEGCVDGRSLKMARPGGIDDADLIVQPVYTLKGSKQLANEIKALDGRLVRLRGELTDLPTEPAGTMIGGTKVTLGT